MNDKFRNMATVYLHRGDRFLLLYRVGSRVIGNSWTGTAGGHLEESELNSPRTCALRELYEETGLTESDIDGLALRYITLRLKNGEIRQNHYFFAELKDSIGEISSNEGRLEWFASEDIPALDMPHSAKHMINHYLSVGRYDSFLYGGVSLQDRTDFAPMEEY